MAAYVQNAAWDIGSDSLDLICWVGSISDSSTASSNERLVHGSYDRDELARVAWQHSACEQDGLHLELETGTCAFETSTQHIFAIINPQQSSRIHVLDKKACPLAAHNDFIHVASRARRK